MYVEAYVVNILCRAASLKKIPLQIGAKPCTRSLTGHNLPEMEISIDLQSLKSPGAEDFVLTVTLSLFICY